MPVKLVSRAGSFMFGFVRTAPVEEGAKLLDRVDQVLVSIVGENDRVAAETVDS